MSDGNRRPTGHIARGAIPGARCKWAVGVMVEIAQGGGDAVKLPVVAAAIGISLSYVEQLSGDLRRRGLITGFKGRDGGYRLAKKLHAISVLDIVVSAQYEGGAKPDGTDRVPASCEKQGADDLWDLLETCQHHLLRHITLADVVSGGLGDHPLLKKVLTIAV